MKLQGIFPALTTPFDSSGDLRTDKLAYNVRKLNNIALSGYAVGGSTGETPMLSFEERLLCLECVRESAAEGKILIAGVSSQSVRESARLANRAAAIGFHVALALTPSYYPIQLRRPESQLLYYRSLADQSDIPVLLYNMPGVTGFNLPTDVIAELSHHPNIAGIKDSSGDLERVTQTLKTAKPGFQLLSGAGANFESALEAGASGAILAIADPLPYACVTVWEALRMRQPEAARDWQERIAPASQCISTRHGIAGLKYAMELNGYYGGPPRSPLPPLSAQDRQDIEQAFYGLRS
jgi:4-hydroxy-2-oxoglutarate aldolase